MITPSDLFPVISWLLLIFFLHLSLVPVFRRLFPGVAVPLSLSISLLFYTLLSFWFTFLGFPPLMAIIPFILIAGWDICRVFRNEGFSGIKTRYHRLPDGWRYYALFLFVFFTMLVLRLYSPDISNAEKFMDHGFIASMMRSPMIPPLDPWFSGGNLSVYYYLGHWMLASLGMTAGIPSPVLFTIALPTIAALAAVNMYGVGHLLLPRYRLLPVVFLFLINPAFVQLAVSGTPWATLFWNSTRVIEGTINEYPLFSFIFGDVHAHVLDFFPQTTLILLIILALTCWEKSNSAGRLLLILCSALALGTVPPTNTWDILVQAPLVLLTGLILLFRSAGLGAGVRRPGILPVMSMVSQVTAALREKPAGGPVQTYFYPTRGAALYLLLVPLLGILCYLPFYLMMRAQGIGGISVVTAPSSISSFLLVSGLFLAIITISVIPVLRRFPWLLILGVPFLLAGYYAAAIVAVLLAALLIRRGGAGDLCAGVALFILLFCEILYLKDNMGEQYFRMNTVFKLYISAWLFFSVAVAVMLGNILLSCRSGISKVINPVVIIVLVLLLVLPVMVTASSAGPHTPTIDGLAWLSLYHPDDRAAVEWLRGQKGNFTLVEAESGDYGYYSRVSSFTGIPAILGWPFHESMWRNNSPEGWYGERTMAVRAIYEDPSRCISLMRQYGADLLYVGKSEDERYRVNLPSSGLTRVFSHGSVTIYRIS